MKLNANGYDLDTMKKMINNGLEKYYFI